MTRSTSGKVSWRIPETHAAVLALRGASDQLAAAGEGATVTAAVAAVRRIADIVAETMHATIRADEEMARDWLADEPGQETPK